MASKLTEKLKVGKSVWENYVAESQKLYCTDPNMRVNTRYSWKIGSAEDAKYLGKGNVGDFSNLEGATIEEVLSRIPEEAVRRELIPEVGKVTEGFEYKWVQDGKTYRVRIHGADASAPAGSNAANGWVVRVQQGKKYLSPISMEFQPPGITKIDSPYYSEEISDYIISILAFTGKRKYINIIKSIGEKYGDLDISEAIGELESRCKSSE